MSASLHCLQNRLLGLDVSLDHLEGVHTKLAPLSLVVIVGWFQAIVGAVRRSAFFQYCISLKSTYIRFSYKQLKAGGEVEAIEAVERNRCLSVCRKNRRTDIITITPVTKFARRRIVPETYVFQKYTSKPRLLCAWAHRSSKLRFNDTTLFPIVKRNHACQSKTPKTPSG